MESDPDYTRSGYGSGKVIQTSSPSGQNATDESRNHRTDWLVSANVIGTIRQNLSTRRCGTVRNSPRYDRCSTVFFSALAATVPFWP